MQPIYYGVFSQIKITSDSFIMEILFDRSKNVWKLYDMKNLTKKINKKSFEFNFFVGFIM